MQQLIEKVRQRGLERGIVYTGKEGQVKYEMMQAQVQNTLKETAELLNAYVNLDVDAIKKTTGEILVTLITSVCIDNKSLFEAEKTLESHNEISREGRSIIIDNFSPLYSISSFILNMDEAIDHKGIITRRYINAIIDLAHVTVAINYELSVNYTLKECLHIVIENLKDE